MAHVRRRRTLVWRADRRARLSGGAPGLRRRRVAFTPHVRRLCGEPPVRASRYAPAYGDFGAVARAGGKRRPRMGRGLSRLAPHFFPTSHVASLPDRRRSRRRMVTGGGRRIRRRTAAAAIADRRRGLCVSETETRKCRTEKGGGRRRRRLGQLAGLGGADASRSRSTRKGTR